ncbi:MAG: galactose mutarotase [Flavobacteriaceae bacterium]|nr:galactose mutarotase [Flavobacteriaceae bacterium]
MKIETSHFGKVNDTNVNLFTLSNKEVVVKFTNYGGIITSIETLDYNGCVKNIVLGFDTLEEYLSEEYLNSYPYFGAIIGRVGNRIANSQFELDGKVIKVSPNRGTFQLHGGFVGFDKVVWEAKTFETNDRIGVELSYLSVDGEEGYPGNLQVKVVYSLNVENEFLIEYFAETDKATPVNLTQHSYFNLGEEQTIGNHDLIINSSEYNELNEDYIPTGKIVSVNQTPYDFRIKKKIGVGLEQLEMGYDKNYILNNLEGNFIKVGELSEEVSGRKMEFFTTEIGMQLYSGAYNPVIKVDGKDKFGPYSGVALETQHFPDSVNHKHFPNTILRTGEKYVQKTMFKFSNI